MSDSELSEFTDVSDEYDEQTRHFMTLCRAPLGDLLEELYDKPNSYHIKPQHIQLANEDGTQKYAIYVDMVDACYNIDISKYNPNIMRHVNNLLSITMGVAKQITELIPFWEYQTGTIYFDYNDRYRISVIIEDHSKD